MLVTLSEPEVGLRSRRKSEELPDIEVVCRAVTLNFQELSMGSSSFEGKL